MKPASLFVAFALAACSSKKSADPTSGSRIPISVTEDGFAPARVKVPQGKPVTLVFERKTDKTCAKEIVLEVGGQKIERALPLDTPVEVVVTFRQAGELTYACGMDMVRGTIVVNGS
jgi:plastocyanin domain-containing protein